VQGGVHGFRARARQRLALTLCGRDTEWAAQ
jgi:hypothetical protein